MDFLSNLQKHDEPNTKNDHESKKPTTHSSDHKPTNSELLNSCKIVADAAKSHFGKEPETKYDKAKVAAAAADILDAAEGYGKLDHTKGVGKYVDQAEEYLRKYGGHSPVAGGGGSAGHHQPTAAPENKSHGEGGAGDYIKMAQGFLHKDKPSGGGDGGGGGGSGDFLKMAGDFFKK